MIKNIGRQWENIKIVCTDAYTSLFGTTAINMPPLNTYEKKLDYTSRDHREQIKNCKNYKEVQSFLISYNNESTTYGQKE